MATTTPKNGWPIPSANGNDSVFNWPSICYQMGMAIDASFAGIPDMISSHGVFANGSKQASDMPATYPVGVSVLGLSSASAESGGWGGTGGVVLTVVRDSGDLANQLYLGAGSVNVVNVLYRFGNPAGWNNWYSLGGSGGAAAVSSGTHTFTFTNVSTSPQTQAITFPTGRFTVAPQVTASTHNAGVSANINSVTASGFNLVLSASDGGGTIPTGDYAVDWIAMQTDGSGS